VCKKSIKNSQPFVKNMKNVRTPRGEFFLTHTVQCPYLIPNLDFNDAQPSNYLLTTHIE